MMRAIVPRMARRVRRMRREWTLLVLLLVLKGALLRYILRLLLL